MQVILLERIEKLGQMGDVVAVKDGFARNYLVPQGKALRATKGNLARVRAPPGPARGGQSAAQGGRHRGGRQGRRPQRHDPAPGRRDRPAVRLGQRPRHRRGVHRRRRHDRPPPGPPRQPAQEPGHPRGAGRAASRGGRPRLGQRRPLARGGGAAGRPGAGCGGGRERARGRASGAGGRGGRAGRRRAAPRPAGVAAPRSRWRRLRGLRSSPVPQRNRFCRTAKKNWPRANLFALNSSVTLAMVKEPGSTMADAHSTTRR